VTTKINAQDELATERHLHDPLQHNYTVWTCSDTLVGDRDTPST
jgi:hypothetical protein